MSAGWFHPQKKRKAKPFRMYVTFDSWIRKIQERISEIENDPFQDYQDEKELRELKYSLAEAKERQRLKKEKLMEENNERD